MERRRSAGIGEGGIHGASLWGQEIVDAIDASKVMVLMISDSAITSDNVVMELSIASEEKKPILPVYLQRSQLPKPTRYQLAGRLKRSRIHPQRSFGRINQQQRIEV